MRPSNSACQDPQGNLFRVELVDVVDRRHPLVRLADEVEWGRFEEAFGVTYAEGVGRPGVPTRLMVALHYLKYAFDLSDEQVLAGWLENPYWQYLAAWRERPLGEVVYPFVLVDATYQHVRVAGQVVSQAALIVMGVRDDGVGRRPPSEITRHPDLRFADRWCGHDSRRRVMAWRVCRGGRW